MELLKTFGFDVQLFIAQIINFLILAYVFKRFLYAPILKTLKDRQDKIKQGLEDSDKSHLALEKAKSDRDKIIKTASKEAEEIIENTKKSALELKESILLDSKKEAEKIINEAKQEAKLEIEKIDKLAKETSLDLSGKILERVISQIFSEKEKQELVKRGVKQIKDYEK